MTDATTVVDITVEKERAVTLVFADGHSCEFALDELRRACPCAGCRNDREAGRVAWPKSSSPLPLTVIDAELTGAWGIRFTWNDQHGTGIYPWDLLRRWCDEGADGARQLPADSGL